MRLLLLFPPLLSLSPGAVFALASSPLHFLPLLLLFFFHPLSFFHDLMYPRLVSDLLCSWDWPWALNLPASASQQLRLYDYTTTPGIFIFSLVHFSYSIITFVNFFLSLEQNLLFLLLIDSFPLPDGMVAVPISPSYLKFHTHIFNRKWAQFIYCSLLRHYPYINCHTSLSIHFFSLCS